MEGIIETFDFWRESDDFARHVVKRHAALEERLDNGLWDTDEEYEAMHTEWEQMGTWLEERGPIQEEVARLLSDDEEEDDGDAGVRGSEDADRAQGATLDTDDIELRGFNTTMRKHAREPLSEARWFEFREWVHACFDAEAPVNAAEDSREVIEQQRKAINAALRSVETYDEFCQAEFGDDDDY